MLNEFKTLWHPEVAEVFERQFAIYEGQLSQMQAQLNYSYELLDEALKKIDALEAAGRAKKPRFSKEYLEKYLPGVGKLWT